MSGAIMAYACCCGTPPPSQVTIDVYRALDTYGYASRKYNSGVIADPSNCSEAGQGGLPIYEGESAVSWSCNFARVHEPFDAYPGPPAAHWNLCTENVNSESYWFAARLWTLPYASTTSSNSSGFWKIDTGSGIVTTTVTAFVSQDIDHYSTTELLPAIEQSGDLCNVCSTETGADVSTTVTCDYWHRATYRFDIAAFQVYSTSGAEAAWTIEVGGGNITVKNGGTTVYTFAQASYTILSIRTAINATAELSAIGGVAANGTVGPLSATLIPDASPVAVGTAVSPATIFMRTVGQTFEEYQSFGYPRYEVSDLAVDAPGFTGTESQFATGFELYWTAPLIDDGTVFTYPAMPDVETTLSGQGDCFDGEGAAIDPPTYVEPVCSLSGGGIDSIPAGSGRANFNGLNWRARTGSTYEFQTGGITDQFWLADNSACGPSAPYHCAGYTAGTFYGKRSKWQLTRT